MTNESPSLPPPTGGATEAGGGSESCAGPSLSARFAPDTDKCGDEIRLIADATNLAGAATATFVIRDRLTGNTVDRASASFNGSQAVAEWECQKEDNQWHAPHLHFIVTAGGTSEHSSNEFTFHNYDDIAPFTVDFELTAQSNPPPPAAPRNFRWRAKYSMEFIDRVLVVRVKIKLVGRQGNQPASSTDPPTAAGRAIAPALKARMKRHIEGYLSNRFALHRQDCERGSACDCPLDRKCCKFPIHVRVEFVESGEHHSVDLYAQPNPPPYQVATIWSEHSNNQGWPHEVGHLIGWYDEYPEGGNAPASRRPPWEINRTNALMGRCTPISRARNVMEFYYNTICRHFGERTGESWELIQVR